MVHHELEFQSTPSAWRVTLAGTQYPYGTGISIHTLRVEGDIRTLARLSGKIISIHTLRVEGDNRSTFLYGFPLYFNPHPPRGG